jgi:hypothetical protein
MKHCSPPVHAICTQQKLYGSLRRFPSRAVRAWRGMRFEFLTKIEDGAVYICAESGSVFRVPPLIQF